MNISKCKKGMMVRISHDIKTTHDRFDSCGEMERMKGKTYPIERFSTYNNYIVIEGFTWDPCDIMEYDNDIKLDPNIFHFDEKTLEGF
jgi:hypothetical protein